MIRLVLGLGFLCALTAAYSPAGRRSGATRTTWDSVYSMSQAARGESSYTKTCARCHKASLAGADESPPLAGSIFLSSWNDQTLGGLHERIHTSMPSDDPGTYSRELVTDVIAYMLKVNGFPAGPSDLPNDREALSGIVLRAAKP